MAVSESGKATGAAHLGDTDHQPTTRWLPLGFIDRRGGLLSMLGGVLGLSVHAGAVALGLSTLLLASATAFTA
jgi:hypothetical protein